MAKKPFTNFGTYDAIDSEWEYEYDENETEDFYFTLDLTAHKTDSIDEKKKKKTSQDDEKLTVQAPPQQPPVEDPSQASEQTSDRTSSLVDFQVLDLHTTNPIVKVDNEIFNCYWSTDLGTQIHIAPAGFMDHPLRAGATVDVVAATRVRLIGKPVTLVQKPEWSQTPYLAGQSVDDAIMLDDDADAPSSSFSASNPATVPNPAQSSPPVSTSTSAPAPATTESSTVEQLTIPTHLRQTQAQEQHASFLEQLSAIKIRKGETDNVNRYFNRSYVRPTNWQAIRQEALGGRNAIATTAAAATTTTVPTTTTTSSASATTAETTAPMAPTVMTTAGVLNGNEGEVEATQTAPTETTAAVASHGDEREVEATQTAPTEITATVASNGDEGEVEAIQSPRSKRKRDEDDSPEDTGR